MIYKFSDTSILASYGAGCICDRVKAENKYIWRGYQYPRPGGLAMGAVKNKNLTQLEHNAAGNITVSQKQ